MPETIPSTCPQCDALLDHMTAMPGGADAPTVVSCPSCEYEETFEK
ncbi:MULTISPECIES: hypothetical protein [Halomicrobium]|uniref:Uncharacterized protein n=1 Tax=Halomicrobium mukohataei (strain ATCC 700874 / DSM 12286 / JCM 9738 / NCIMB 13541) TaxID=485914 RepID=C7NW89_HALMD|nr:MULTISPECIES: hypothetical protein [Halomicrobium]ACV46230.1 hypothetical protein Hmuk_0091 [Halomicrobium mukohataei DSM 12286]